MKALVRKDLSIQETENIHQSERYLLCKPTLTKKEATQRSVKNTEFYQEHSCKPGLRCIMVMKNYGPAEGEGVISI